ncbi:BTAD domain-containing putative transcriptional regulator [Nonomuraea aurantiaca]|uniref:BTAD domain-containing putative transcriptional regulator n=1 Tax=Nonomuraea aurantiaca TaxID=2878562 RepID=UPI001CDA2457|nr:BTAD domain-containing putative transcriptional regulator [Nonomuraea aurantiaca]MCA2223050.1 tetratricopeptide repeat protein [Nonomuraea aurantiaca]
MRFGVLGPLSVWTPDGQPVQVPEAKVRALLADLLAHRGRPVSTDRLIEDLWGDRPPGDAPAALRVKVSQLRRALGDRSLVVFRPPGYLLAVDAEEVDAGLFESLLARAGQSDDARVRQALLTEALGLWRGAPYAEFGDFARAAVARLEEQRLVALEELAETRLELGDHGALAAELAELVDAHPLRERLRAAHLRALYRAGRQSEALAGYGRLRGLLAEELGIDPAPELTALHAAILRQDPSLDPPAPLVDRTPSRPPASPADPPHPHPPAPPADPPHPHPPATNLPVPLTELIGRDAEVAEVRSLLRTGRLVTLTGPGGVGKTRLALEAAAEPGRPFPGGVWLVELASAAPSAEGVVAEVVATVLGVRDDLPGSVVDRLAAALRTRATLLVLDNCEHVVDQVAELAERLLRAAPELRVLATSQESLRVPGEVLWSVPPLGPEAAARLLAARAGIGPGDDGVAEICARLDGIPLALELAATRLRALTPRRLAARLDDRFRVLATGHRGAPARQRTLRAMIDWSWELLTGGERVVLRRLAVHADGCTLEAAEAICAEPGLDVLDLLARLVDRSLVVRAPGGRYRLLESVAAYSLERLSEAGETEAARLRHARHHADLAERAEPGLRGPEQRQWLALLDADAANLRAAIETSLRLGATDEAVRLVNALAWYWVLRGRLGEGQRTLEAVLAVADDAQARVWLAGLRMLSGQGRPPGVERLPAGIADPGRRARAQWFMAFTLYGFDDPVVTDAFLDSALESFRALDDRWGTAAALSLRARRALLRGDLAALRQDGERGLELFREVGDRWGEMRAAENLGTLAEITGDYAQAADLRRDGLRGAEELGLWSEVSGALSRLGRVALLTGDLDGARELHERARRLAVARSDVPLEEFAEVGLALVARRQGRLDEAERLLRRWLRWVREVAGEPGAALILAELGFVAEQRGDAVAALEWQREGLAVARRVGDPRAIALALEGLAGARALGGDHEEAAGLLDTAGALRASVGAPLPEAERGDVDRIAASVRTALDRRATVTDHS